jgi:hypothetical protein
MYLVRFIWPTITDKDSARFAIRLGVFAFVLSSLLYIVFVTLNEFLVPFLWFLIFDLFIDALCIFFLWTHSSRFAAMIAFFKGSYYVLFWLMLAGFLDVFPVRMNMSTTIIFMQSLQMYISFVFLGLINGLRGAFLLPVVEEKTGA